MQTVMAYFPLSIIVVNYMVSRVLQLLRGTIYRSIEGLSTAHSPLYSTLLALYALYALPYGQPHERQLRAADGSSGCSV